MDIDEVLSMPSQGREDIGKTILKRFLHDSEWCIYLSGNRFEINGGINPSILNHLGTPIKKIITKHGHSIRLIFL
jgi:hypothetical protein